MISPWAKRNYVAHSISDQSSILRFIEDNWGTGRIGDGSFDAKAGTLNNMFDFAPAHFGSGHAGNGTLFLNESTGEPVSRW